MKKILAPPHRHGEGQIFNIPLILILHVGESSEIHEACFLFCLE